MTEVCAYIQGLIQTFWMEERIFGSKRLSGNIVESQGLGVDLTGIGGVDSCAVEMQLRQSTC